MHSLSRSSGSNSDPDSTDHRDLIIGNTHVCFNPSRGEVKLGQVRSLMAKVCAYERDGSHGQGVNERDAEFNLHAYLVIHNRRHTARRSMSKS